jgi:hypothetical protein
VKLAGPSPDQVTRELEEIANAEFFYAAADKLIARWSAVGTGPEIATPIFRFIEEHPHDVDYGTPGSLVHFIEGFGIEGYEDQLIASLHRRPTPLTVLMLNRWINGATRDRERLLALLSGLAYHPQADAETRRQIAHFKDYQASKN